MNIDNKLKIDVKLSKLLTLAKEIGELDGVLIGVMDRQRSRELLDKDTTSLQKEFETQLSEIKELLYKG